MVVAQGRIPLVWDVDPARREIVAAELDVRVAESQEEALACDIVITVTPGKSVLFPPGSLRPGQHVSLDGRRRPRQGRGGDRRAGTRTPVLRRLGPGKPRRRAGGRGRGRDVTRDAVTELGGVLAGARDGRVDDDEVTVFDSTGLAIQDLAIARAAFMKSPQLELPRLEL